MTQKTDTWMPLLISRYLADTMHLSTEQHGAYLLLLMHGWTHDGALPREDEKLRRITRMPPRGWSEQKDDLLAFFTEVEGALRQKRMDAELVRWGELKAKKSAAGKASAAKRLAQQEDQQNGNRCSTGVQQNTQHNPPTESNPSPSPSSIPSELKENMLSHVPARPEAKQRQSVPDCPHLSILALWEEVLPAMPQHLPSMWKGTRASHLRARWREAAVEKVWTEEGQGLMYFRKIFGYVGQSAFLTGKTDSRDRRPFQIELAWLVNPTNWAKTLEGKYHQEATA